MGYAGCRLILPADANFSRESIDYPGALLFSAGMASFLLVISHGMEWGWRSSRALTGVAVAAAALAAFIVQERRTRHPVLDLSIFANWPFLAGNLSGILSFMATFANNILLPFYLHEVKHMPIAGIGMVMSAFPVMMAIAAPFSGALSDKTGPRGLTAAGLALMAVSLYYTAGLGEEAGMASIVAGQALLGLGNGLFQSPNNSSVMSSLPPDKAGVAGGVNALARYLGMVSGTALAVSIFEYRRLSSLLASNWDGSVSETSAYLAGFHDALLAAAVLAVLGAFISLNRRGYAKIM